MLIVQQQVSVVHVDFVVFVTTLRLGNGKLVFQNIQIVPFAKSIDLFSLILQKIIEA